MSKFEAEQPETRGPRAQLVIFILYNQRVYSIQCSLFCDTVCLVYSIFIFLPTPHPVDYRTRKWALPHQWVHVRKHEIN